MKNTQKEKMVNSSYDLLVQKLDQFIRKYYLNKVLRGALLWVALILLVFVIFSFFEYQFYFSKGVRKGLFGAFLLTFTAGLGFWVLKPLLKYFNLGSLITHEQAAKILGDHFPDVNDRLLNILQLKSQSASTEELSLIEASINQKSEGIRLVPFRKAIDLKENRKYFKYALPPFLLLVGFLFIDATIITDSTYRIINNSQEFEREAPFRYNVLNENLTAVEYDDFTLRVTTDGEIVPDEIFLDYSGYQYRLQKVGGNEFIHTFNNLQEDTKFNLFSGDVISTELTIDVLEKPSLLDYMLGLTYPKYTEKQKETIANIGDVIIPEGTQIDWTFNAKNTDQISLKFNDGTKIDAKRNSQSEFSHRAKFRNNTPYLLSFNSKIVPNGDSLSFYINVIKDKHPSISVERFQDSIENNIFFFAGNVSDDYGLKNLNFNYEILTKYGSIRSSQEKSVKSDLSNNDRFDYIFDINEIALEPGEEVRYFFEVFDNDQVNGSKSSKSSIMKHRKATIEEFKEEEQANEEKINKDLDESIQDIEEMQRKLQKLREDLLQKKEMDWQDKKKMEELLEQQQELQKKLEDAKQKNEENLKNQEEYLKLPEEVREKQERLQELFEEMTSDKSKELMEKIQELMEEMNKEQSLQLLDEMQLEQENMEKHAERLKELYKQLEVEKEMNESIEELNKIAEELEELSEETKEESANKEELDEKHEEINKDFEELKEKMEELKEKNDDLEYPKPMEDDAPEQMEEINDELKESQEQLQKDQKKPSSQKQKSAAGKMKKMAEAMQGDMEGGEMEQMQEDLETLRQLLENIITLSFDQENIVNDLNRSRVNTPKYTSLTQEQLKIKDDFQIVEDSLQELSKRQEKIESFITEKVNEVNSNLDKSMVKLEAREKAEAHQHQRFSMKNLNDLALMLSESMEHMQQQMSGMMPGSQMCKKPGQGQGKSGRKPSDKISQGQKGLSKNLKELQEKMKNGQNGSAKEFAEAAAQQAALRKALQEMMKQRQEEGKGASGELQDIINNMDKQEVDLVNKRLDNEMMKRQQDILSRLLDAENAERQREFENKRKSNDGADKKRKLPPSLEEYLKKRNAETDFFKNTSPELNSYYQHLVDEYFRALKAS